MHYIKGKTKYANKAFISRLAIFKITLWYRHRTPTISILGRDFSSFCDTLHATKTAQHRLTARATVTLLSQLD